MKWIQAKVVFESDNSGLLAEAIAQVFHDLGCKGVIIEDPGTPQGLDWCDELPTMPDKPAVWGYFSEKHDVAALRKALETDLAKLATGLGFFHQIHYNTVAEEDWSESWKAFFKPTPVGRRLVVKPSWSNWQPAPGQLVVEIDPGMAFGTGTHPSTALCMALLETHLPPGASFLDIGTGSGILMITAARLGAGMVWGTDNDPVAVEVARNNLLANKLDPGQFKIIKTNLVEGIQQRFQVLAANILAGVIIELAPRLDHVMQPGGLFLCSGIIEPQAEQVIKALENQGLNIVDSITEKEWIALAGRFHHG